MPERIAPDFEDRSSIVAPIIFTLILLGAAALWFYSDFIKAMLNPAKPEVVFQTRYQDVYDRLGISSLPNYIERTDSSVSPLLDQLRREPCDRAAILPLATLLNRIGYPREAATSVQRFGDRCGHSEALLEQAYSSLMRIRDLPGALAVATQLVTLDQARSRFRYLRGNAYEELKNYKSALSDYSSALQLFTNLSKVASSEFYRVSRMYAALGRPCDAITPLDMYLSYDVSKRQTAQISQLIREYANSGDCRASYASGADRLLVPPSNIIDVTINGAKGRMIVDTGASMVSMSAAFASRARILPDEGNPMTFQVVGGTFQSAPGNAQLIEVGNARAANVPVAVSIGKIDAYGPQVDGLLGMTFLARFKMSLSGGALELKPRDLN
jgi:aspartyl protease family protein